MSTLLEALNPVQQEAVRHRDGPILVLAGAGSGKTRIITHRVAKLIEDGTNPQQILGITFTNKAAREMVERVNSLLGVTGQAVLMATIHSTCARILRREVHHLDNGLGRDFIIADASDQLSLIKKCMKALDIDKNTAKPNEYQRLFSKAKNKHPDVTDWEKNDQNTVLGLSKMWDEYHRQLRASNTVDFDDLLILVYDLFSGHPSILEHYQRRWRYIMVDEFQDVNVLQYRIIQLLASKYRNLLVVGDDDQLIYGWRGANVETIMNFEKDFPGARVLTLDQNYRSTKTILEAASSVSGKIKRRRKKTLWTENKTGAKITVYLAKDEWDEARYLANLVRQLVERENFRWQDIAILYRTNAQSRVMEGVFNERNIPYHLVGEVGFYKRREIRDLISYLQLMLEPRHRQAFYRIINVPPRSIGDKTVERITNYADEHGLTLMDAISDEMFLETCPPRLRYSLEQFTGALNMTARILDEDGPSAAVQSLMTAIDYMAWLRSDSELQAESRLENISQLINALVEYDTEAKNTNRRASIQSFLENATLASESDDYDKNKPRLTMMTLHCAKGLEFPVVFIAGMVEGLLPHSFSLRGQDRSIDEERRICYVGFTRAKRLLFLTCPLERRTFGAEIDSSLSRFVIDIPSELMTVEQNNHVQQDVLMLARANLSVSGGRSRSSSRAASRMTSPIEDPYVPPPRPSAVPSPPQSLPPQAANVSSGSSGELAYRLGTRVRHPRWGLGTVIQIQGGADRTKLLISFPGFGRKLLLLELAPLEIVER